MGKGGFKGTVPKSVRILLARKDIDDMYKYLKTLYGTLRSRGLPVSLVRNRIRSASMEDMLRILNTHELSIENVTPRNVNALVDEFIEDEERRRRELRISHARSSLANLGSELQTTYWSSNYNLDAALNSTNYTRRAHRVLNNYQVNLNEIYPDLNINNVDNLAYRFLNLNNN